MAEKSDESDGTPLVTGGKRGERSNSSSSPEIRRAHEGRTYRFVKHLVGT